MKKTAFAIVVLVLLVSVVFAACGGADDGKVTDTTQGIMTSDTDTTRVTDTTRADSTSGNGNNSVLTDLSDGVSEGLSDLTDSMSDPTGGMSGTDNGGSSANVTG